MTHLAAPKRRVPSVTLSRISTDNETSHKKFAKKFALPFTLLTDTDHSISDKYGAYGQKVFMGRTYMGVYRKTFLIDEKGKIKRIFEKVKPDEHAREVLEAFKG